MENIIEYNKYEEYKQRIGKLSKKGYIDAIEFLKGKSCKTEYEEIDDCAVDLLSILLKMDWGRSIVIEYTKEDMNFIKSTYLSNFFKESIKEMLGASISEELEKILNSNLDINNMSEHEIETIYNEIQQYYKLNGKSPKSNISSRFISYLYKLDGPGIISYIKNKMYPGELARQILLTSGLNDRGSYYSGRGVNFGDLSDKNLVAIYKKLLKLDYNYATDFVRLVDDMRTLGATEFIETFLNYGYNGFNYQNKRILSDRNISLDGLEGESAYLVGTISFFESTRRDEFYQESQTESMKYAFHYKIDRINKKIINKEEITQEDIEILNKLNSHDLIFVEYIGRERRKRY